MFSLFMYLLLQTLHRCKSNDFWTDHFIFLFFFLYKFHFLHRLLFVIHFICRCMYVILANNFRARTCEIICNMMYSVTVYIKMTAHATFGCNRRFAKLSTYPAIPLFQLVHFACIHIKVFKTFYWPNLKTYYLRKLYRCKIQLVRCCTMVWHLK